MKLISALFTTPDSASAHLSVKLFTPALLLAVALLTFSVAAEAGVADSAPGNGGLSITFSDDGAGGTAINASGSGITDADNGRSGPARLGFGRRFDQDLSDVTAVDSPLRLLGESVTQNVILSDRFTLNLSGYEFGNLEFTTFNLNFQQFSFRAVGTDGFIFIPANSNLVSNTGSGESQLLTVVDGAGAFALPYSTFISLYGQSFPSTDGFTFVFAEGLPLAEVVAAVAVLSPDTAAGGGSSNPSEPIILVTNVGAIISTTTSGLSSIGSTLDSVQNAAQNATGDLNNRIFNARSGGTQGGNGGGIASTLDGTSRYLDFAQKQNIDYRVALGLADGETVDIVDTLSSGGGHPFAMVGVPAFSGSAVIAVEGGSGKNSVTDKVVIEEVPHTKYEVFSSFDYGFYDQDNLTRNQRGFEVDSYAGSAGFEMRLTDWLVAGTAFTYLESNTNSTANLGSSDLDGEIYSVYATAFHKTTYLDFLYSYGDFNNDISRNTLLGRTAYGDTESHSNSYRLNAGHTIHVDEKFSFGPSAGLNYTTGEVDGYTERNGGLANLIYPDHDFESMIGRLGGYATFRTETGFGMLTTQASAGWAHEFQPENGNVTASLETSPFALVTGNSARSIGGFTASEERAHAGTDWLELGATTRLDIQNTGFNFELGYQGQFFRNNASGHFGSAKVGYEW